ncbi:heptaprenyl pyrophosphate synthase subunit A [Staphylococcus caeli]|uniref:Component A of hexaprenyl diphosphate synthase n=1 Tax=Staphylococcus caeli TaxID=2201815 RepID=A0A1D4P0P5_9STAP|nr:heptaprenyl pyrophosphate synthase subunit A [Staphylococcus caeli]SCT04100.1 component A of hexaprenyl diphosphate synthase [Staphylococcus caeli]SCT16431.1 component A of hexaprenyl diphosphate synthase [Staphylococcus caeli]
METTFSILETQIIDRLHDVDYYESIYINKALAQILDSYDIPQEAKLACLTIDTAMRHLDEVTTSLSSKKSILIGDLLSAHFYTILAKLNDPVYQQLISSAIVTINEMKSSIHQGVLSDDKLDEYILKIENTFPLITINHFASVSNQTEINATLLKNITEHHPAYLKHYSNEKLNSFSNKVNTEIHLKRGNEHGR